MEVSMIAVLYLYFQECKQCTFPGIHVRQWEELTSRRTVAAQIQCSFDNS